MEKSKISTVKYRYKNCIYAINYFFDNWHGDIWDTFLNWWDWITCDLDDVIFAECHHWSFWSMMSGNINFLPRKTAIDSIEHLRSLK